MTVGLSVSMLLRHRSEGRGQEVRIVSAGDLLPMLGIYLPSALPGWLTAAFQVALIVGLLVSFLYCWFLQECLLDLPAGQRQAPAWSVWLILMPIISHVAAWILLPFLIPRSFRNFFASIDDQRFGDCGRAFALMAVLGLTLAPALALRVQWLAVLSVCVGLIGLGAYTWRMMRMRRAVRHLRRMHAGMQARERDDTDATA
ncbi:MAG: hypothetical protein ACOCXA_00070 [Planctomycetota bacterium]